jgi:hypothetical protein
MNRQAQPESISAHNQIQVPSRSETPQTEDHSQVHDSQWLRAAKTAKNLTRIVVNAVRAVTTAVVEHAHIGGVVGGLYAANKSLLSVPDQNVRLAALRGAAVASTVGFVANYLKNKETKPSQSVSAQEESVVAETSGAGPASTENAPLLPEPDLEAASASSSRNVQSWTDFAKDCAGDAANAYVQGVTEVKKSLPFGATVGTFYGMYDSQDALAAAIKGAGVGCASAMVAGTAKGAVSALRQRRARIQARGLSR